MHLARVAGCLLFVCGIFLEGCGGGGDGPSPSPPGPGPSPGPSPGPPWHSNPIEVRGQHLYDSVTGESFYARGIAFPNLGAEASINDYIRTIARLKSLSSNINMIRMYEFPPCIWDTQQGWCIAPFMEEADKLGIYVLVAATGSQSGYLPVTGWTDAQDCYRQGGVLDMGRGIVQRFNYPNTLAIVIGNEFLGAGTFSVISVLKAYARDLKAYMDMCNFGEDSPSHGVFRKIPLLYASNDDHGDALDQQKAAYLFCGSDDTSIDIFGLNVERWCSDTVSDSYDDIQTWVDDAKYPGSFIFSEMGCPQNLYPGSVRHWSQVNDFFATFSAFDGFAAYSYWSPNEFIMFEAATPDAKELPDGENFFAALDAVGAMAKREPGSTAYAECKTHMPEAQLGAQAPIAIEPLSGIHAYNQDQYPSSECPAPRVRTSGSAGRVVV